MNHKIKRSLRIFMSGAMAAITASVCTADQGGKPNDRSRTGSKQEQLIQERHGQDVRILWIGGYLQPNLYDDTETWRKDKNHKAYNDRQAREDKVRQARDRAAQAKAKAEAAKAKRQADLDALRARLAAEKARREAERLERIRRTDGNSSRGNDTKPARRYDPGRR